MDMIPEVYFGTTEPVDWRSQVEDEPDDDEERPTPPEVVAMLGFDPAREEPLRKAHIKAHPRRTPKGAVTQVRDYERWTGPDIVAAVKAGKDVPKEAFLALENRTYAKKLWKWATQHRAFLAEKQRVEEATRGDTYPNGRKVPKAGDEVFQQVRGMFGTPAAIHGTVYAARGGSLRVRVLGSTSLMGGGAPVGKTYPLDTGWSVKGDPWFKEQEKARVKTEATEKRRAASRARAAQKKRTSSVEAALRGGHKPLNGETARVGMVVVGHYPGGEGVRLVVTDVVPTDRGFDVYARPEEHPDYCGGFLGHDLHVYTVVPPVRKLLATKPGNRMLKALLVLRPRCLT